MNKPYFYQFLEPINKEMAMLARELEPSIYSNPRTMLMHARVFLETILQMIIEAEKLALEPRAGLKEQLDLLDANGLLTTEIRNAFHHVRLIGNEASHNPRQFRISEALVSWEKTYQIVKWYVEVYGPLEAVVPGYQEPVPPKHESYGTKELEERLKKLEEMIKKAMDRTTETASAENEEEVEQEAAVQQPGFTTIRTLTYKGETLAIPYFLRDAFLLPQRFVKSETFLIRLGAEQQARLMSELPDDLEGLHKHVKRYNETNDENLFQELKTYIAEEKARRQLKLQRPGELFFFYKDDYVVVTEALATTPITTDEFRGFPSLIHQLNEQGYYTVSQLPNELVMLAKYKNVGIGTLEKLFEQLKEK